MTSPVQPDSASQIGLRPFGQPVIGTINSIGVRTLYMKEVRRFFKVQTQTIWAPAVTTLLYLIIFTVALGRSGREVMGVPFASFIAPGLIVMGMMQNAFANSSFSLLVGKIQGTIVDYLTPPLGTIEVLGALTAGAITRAVLVGLAVYGIMLFWPGVDVTVRHLGAVIFFGLAGSLLLALLGVLTSIWAEKFDHAAAVTNFVIAPLSLLSGTFYALKDLPGTFATISHFNPFAYVISGFRYGFLGVEDLPIWQGALVLTGLNIVLGTICYRLLKTGWKIKS